MISQSSYWEIGKYLEKLHIYLPLDLVILFVGIYLKDILPRVKKRCLVSYCLVKIDMSVLKIKMDNGKLKCHIFVMY